MGWSACLPEPSHSLCPRHLQLCQRHEEVASRLSLRPLLGVRYGTFFSYGETFAVFLFYGWGVLILSSFPVGLLVYFLLNRRYSLVIKKTSPMWWVANISSVCLLILLLLFFCHVDFFSVLEFNQPFMASEFCVSSPQMILKKFLHVFF